MVALVAIRKSIIWLPLLALSLKGCTSPNTSPGNVGSSKYIPQVESVAFYGSIYAWLVTFKGDLLKTDDGGRNWETIPGQGVGRFDKITFINERNGWATSKDGQVLYTADGGNTWVSIARLGDGKYEHELGYIKFIDEKHGWIVNPRSIWRTEDGGASWQQYSSPYDYPKKVFSCSFINPNIGWLSGVGGAFYRTQDGGKSWQESTVVSDERDLSEPSFVDHQVGWIVARPNDGIYRTEDGGKTWTLLRDPGKLAEFYSVQFTSRREGWAAGLARTNEEPEKQKVVVLHTTDGGNSWERVRVAENELFFHTVYFTDSTYGWLLARDNVYRTDDGGKSWRIVLELPPLVQE
jgi:photosystem II stability/assembly factor-like uncharacterized protein